MMYYKTKLGQEGEQLAVEYLIKNNYKIIEKNFRTRLGELDIIAQDRKEIVFIEVKTRTSTNYGEPCEAVDYKKMQHIIRVAEYYIHIKKLENAYIRFDVIEVLLQEKKMKINHIKQVI